MFIYPVYYRIIGIELLLNIKNHSITQNGFVCAPGRNRTHNLGVRSASLYPFEPLGQCIPIIASGYSSIKLKTDRRHPPAVEGRDSHQSPVSGFHSARRDALQIILAEKTLSTNKVFCAIAI